MHAMGISFIRINDKVLRVMDISEKSDKELEIYLKRTLRKASAVTVKGVLSDYSTKELHRHSFHQLLLIKRGVSVLVDSSSSQGLFGLQCAFIPAGVSHRSVVVGNLVSYQSLYVRQNLFSCDEHEIRIFTMSVLCAELFNRLGTIRKIVQSDPVNDRVFELLLDIVLEDMKKKKLFIRLPSPRTDAGKRVVEFIERNYMKNISLVDFRNVIPLSTRQIARLFSEDCGMTIFEYLRAYRVMMSAVHLGGMKEILDTAYSCGYHSISSFYSDFKRITGMSPSQFRSVASGK
jgi:AraC-like DNA-binding protein